MAWAGTAIRDTREGTDRETMEGAMRPATRSVVGHCDSGVSICVREKKHTDSMLTIILVNAKHSNVFGYPWRQRSLA